MHFTQSLFALITAAGMASAFTGDGTWYHTGLGACGWTNVDTDLVVALSTQQYAHGSRCGSSIQVFLGKQSVTARVVDECPGCAGDSIDLSPAAFSALASQDVGRISVTWNYLLQANQSVSA